MKSEKALGFQYYQWFFYFLAAFLAAMVVLMRAFDADTIAACIEGADTPALLLQGYADWYQSLAKISLPVMLIPAVAGLAAVIFYIVNWKNPKYERVRIRLRINHIPVAMPLLILFFYLFFLFVVTAMLNDVQPAQNAQSFREDAAAIEEGKLITEEVQMSPTMESTGYIRHSEDYPKNLICYSVTGTNKSGWTGIYVPDFSDFEPDREHLYNENKSIEWNDTHATTYRVTYTPNYHLVISIEIVYRGED